MKKTPPANSGIVFAACALLSVAARAEVEGTRPTANRENEPTARHIRYSFTLQNTTAHPIPEATFLTYAPLERTATQHCRNLEASHAYTMEHDARGNRIMRFVFKDFPPYSTRIVSVRADLSLFAKPRQEPVAPMAHLSSQGLFVFDRSDFDKLAPSFPPGTNAFVTSRRMFDWIRAHIRHAGYTRRDRGALYALRERRGDCTELTSLFVALARRDGIPARGLGGYVCHRNTILPPSGYHNWAEFYAEGTWHVVDCQRNRFQESAASYVAMCVLGEADSPMRGFPRFRCQGKGIKAKMNATP